MLRPGGVPLKNSSPLRGEVGRGAVLEGIAAAAGWDSFTLSLQISRWLDQNRHTEALAGYKRKVQPFLGNT